MKKGYKLLNKLLIVYGLCILCFNDILNRTNFVKSLEINSPNLQLLVTNSIGLYKRAKSMHILYVAYGCVLL